MLSNQHYRHRANQKLRSWANAVFQNRGVCGQAVPSLPSPSPVIHFFCSCPSFLYEPREETLATQAKKPPARTGGFFESVRTPAYGSFRLVRNVRLSIKYFGNFPWESFEGITNHLHKTKSKYQRSVDRSVVDLEYLTGKQGNTSNGVHDCGR